MRAYKTADAAAKAASKTFLEQEEYGHIYIVAKGRSFVLLPEKEFNRRKISDKKVFFVFGKGEECKKAFDNYQKKFPPARRELLRLCTAWNKAKKRLDALAATIEEIRAKEAQP
jgi:hypothetical protein